MQVIQETLDDLKKIEGRIKDLSENEVGIDDDLFLRASIAQSKAIAGLALAIEESGLPDTRRLTMRAPDKKGQDTVKQDYPENKDAVWLCPDCSFLIDMHFSKCHNCDEPRPDSPIIYELALVPTPFRG
jgi:hypothetical protein